MTPAKWPRYEYVAPSQWPLLMLALELLRTPVNEFTTLPSYQKRLCMILNFRI